MSDLRAWNHLHGNTIHAGQRLVLRRDEPSSVTAAKAPEKSSKKDDDKGGTEYIYHTVQPGDTLWGIAQNYPGVTVEDLKRLNGDMNTRHLSVGEKIKVGVDKG